MSTYYIIYHALIFTVLILAIIAAKRGIAAMRFIAWLLALTLVIELMAEYLIQAQKPFAWVYHLFVLFDYALLCAYYLYTKGTQRRQPVVYSIPFFILVSLGVSVWVYQFKSFPSANLTISGALLFTIYTHLLFNLDGTATIPVYRHPNFWIAMGVLLFYGGTFLFHGIYAHLLQLNESETLKLFAKINRPLNLLLYSCFIIGILCSLQKLKYTTQ